MLSAIFWKLFQCSFAVYFLTVFWFYYWGLSEGFKKRFNWLWTAEQIAQKIGSNIKGKSVLITGANSGIGEETTRVLLKHGARVFMACRNRFKAEKCRHQILHSLFRNKALSNEEKKDLEDRLEIFVVDLSSLQSIYVFAEEFLSSDRKIHILINNAGVMAFPNYMESVDGFELQFAVNHLGHFFLTKLLMPRICESTIKSKSKWIGKIINVSSIGHKHTLPLHETMDFCLQNVCGPPSDRYNNWKNYGFSKAANILHSNELNKRYGTNSNSKVFSISLHPGVIRTNLGQNLMWYEKLPAILLFKLPGLTKSIEHGASTTVYAACLEDELFVKQSGRFFKDNMMAENILQASEECNGSDMRLQMKLWVLSEKLIEKKGFEFGVEYCSRFELLFPRFFQNIRKYYFGRASTMASLSKLIKFRMLLNQLDDSEFGKFIKDLTTQCGREIVHTALFNQFSNRRHVPSSEQTLDNAVSIIQSIVRNREPPNTADQNIRAGMHSLSTDLTGEIASYLELDDYVSFGRCNRDTYIGSTSPCTLKTLDLTNVDNYRLVDLRKYPQIQFLALNLQQSNDLVLLNDTTICNHLTKMELNNKSKPDADIDGILNTVALPFANITHLRLMNFGFAYPTPDDGGAVHRFFPQNKITKLFSKFPNIHHLDQCGVYFDPDELAMAQIQNCFPNLITLKLNGGDSAGLQKMLSVFGNKIHALQVQSYDFNLPSHVSFQCIQELALTGSLSAAAVWNGIQESTESLKRLYFYWDESDQTTQLIDAMSRQKQLQQLMLCVEYKNVSQACAAIERGIFNNRKIAKENIQITLGVDSGHSMKAADIMFNIVKMINTLLSAAIEDFVFCWHFEEPVINTLENWESEIQDFKKQIRAECKIQYSDYEIMIANDASTTQNYIFNSLLHGWLTDYF